MFENERAVAGFMLKYAEMLTADIPEPQMMHQPAPGVHTPRWILGHLAVSTDFGCRMLGDARDLCPQAWYNVFGRGSDGVGVTVLVPTQAELMEKLTAGVERLGAAAVKADAKLLAQPHGVPLFADTTMLTVGHVAAHLLTSHFAMHLGQLSMWRRVAGYPHLF